MAKQYFMLVLKGTDELVHQTAYHDEHAGDRARQKNAEKRAKAEVKKMHGIRAGDAAYFTEYVSTLEVAYDWQNTQNFGPQHSKMIADWFRDARVLERRFGFREVMYQDYMQAVDKWKDNLEIREAKLVLV